MWPLRRPSSSSTAPRHSDSCVARGASVASEDGLPALKTDIVHSGPWSASKASPSAPTSGRGHTEIIWTVEAGLRSRFGRTFGALPWT